MILNQSQTKVGVRVTRRDFSTDIYEFHSVSQAQEFCVEEVKWESTLNVYCHRLSFNQKGDFATPAEITLMNTK